MSRPLPKKLRDYHIVARLQSGGMGTVFKAVHGKLKRPVALKLLNLGGTEAGAVARFHREIEAIGRLDHPNIVRATDAGEEGGYHFLVMDLVEGIDLSNLVDRAGPLAIADACELIRQAALGLQHVHEHKLVHRDIKPSNLMLARDGRVRLLDLGLALLRSQTAGNELTSTGQIMGTVDYMAPEQARDTHSVDIRADLYSLGCTLYKLLTGGPPFNDPKYASNIEKLLAHVEDPPPPLRQRRADCPAALAKVMDQLLAKDPAQRLANPAQVAAALQPFTAGCNLRRVLQSAGIAPDETATSSATSVIQEPEAVVSRRRKLPSIQVLLGTGIAGAMLLAGALYLVLRPGNEQNGSANPAIGNTPSSVSSAEGWTELLARIVPDRVQTVGTWTMERGTLVSEPTGFARIEVPYEPPEEYDYRVEFTAREGSGEVCQLFAKGDIQARYAMWCLNYATHGFVWDNSVFNDQNPTFRRAEEGMQTGRRYVALIEVRNNGVRGYLDGRLLSHWQTDYRNLPNNLGYSNRLGVGCYESRIVFHRIAVREVTGRGRLIR